MIGGSSPGRGWEFSPHHRVQTGSGAHSASYPVGTRGSFLGVKLPGREADHSPPYSAEVKMCGVIPPLPQYAFIAWRVFTGVAQQYTACQLTDVPILKHAFN
jgi:hypothetical protein